MRGLSRLLDLQEVDSATDRLEARRKSLEAGNDVAAARGLADDAEAQQGELGLQLDALDRDIGRLEHEIDSLTRKAAEDERRLFDGSVVNAKELSSLQKDVDQLKRRRSEREDELLALMESREELEGQASEARQRTDELRTEVERAQSLGASELERLRVDLEELLRRREEILPELDPELLDLYEELRPQKKGVAAVALVEGVCQGCHEQLSAVEMDRIRHSDAIARCEHCRRILVL
jgi:hypothetical protein